MSLGLLMAVLVGISLGLMGGGGSILTVPIFVYLLGFETKESIAMSLAVVGFVSLFGAFSHWKAGNVNLRIAAIFGVFSMIATFGGARLAAMMSGTMQLLIFAVVMLAAAFFMFRGKSPAESGVVDAQPEGAPLRLGLIAVEATAVGILSGIVGVGGGFLIVPALVLLGKIPMKQAVGTSLLIIALKSVAGFAGYYGQVEVDWGFMALFTGAAVVGIMIGTRLVRFVSQHTLKRGFAVFLVLMSAWIFYQNLGF